MPALKNDRNLPYNWNRGNEFNSIPNRIERAIPSYVPPEKQQPYETDGNWMKQNAPKREETALPDDGADVEPDLDEDDGVQTTSSTDAMDVIGQVMQYGRQKMGVMGGDQTDQTDQEDQSGDQEQTQSFADGGPMEDDSEQPAIPEDDNEQQQPQQAPGGNMDAAWGLVQHYRQKYDAYRSFAAAAMDGIQGKPPDIMAAARAATQAYPNALHGSTVNFTPTQGGITAAVTMPGERAPSQQIRLSPQAFQQFLKGPAGQFDNVQANGPKVLQQLAGGGQQRRA